MTQNRASGRDMWNVTDPRSIEEYGVEVTNPGKISTWCQAYFYGGNTLRLWNEATELKITFLTACGLQKGQKILLICKYASESGIEQVVGSLIGQEGQLSLEEIGSQAISAFKNAHITPDARLQWDFNYLNTLADESVDRVILFGAASHVWDWEDYAQHVCRVLCNGGRVIIANAPWDGKELLTAAHLDTHTEGILARLLSGMKINEEDLPTIGPEELKSIFQPHLRWSRGCSWQGLYLFYGQKGGEEESQSFEFPVSTQAVQKFLTEKPSTGPWDFSSAAEMEILGPEVTDIDKQKKWGRIINLGGGFIRMDDYSSVIQPMWKNPKS